MGAMKKSIHTSEYATLCRELRAARKGAGLSQRALAVRLKVSPSWVAKVEIGERRIDLIEFVRFVVACRVEATDVFARIAKAVPAKGRGTSRMGGD